MPWYTHEQVFGGRIMDRDELACLVRNMRRAQQKSHRTGNPNDVGIARDWERHVDDVLANLAEGPGLFDRDNFTNET